MAAEARSAGGASVGRPYRSRLREQQTAATRGAVVDAARELFVANGWAGTGMRDVAAAAGVALETVYSHFSSKRGLLRAVADTAVVGDDASEPLAARAEFVAMGEGRRPVRVRAAARLLAAVHARTAAIAKLLRLAAAADHGIAEMLQLTRERQRSDVASALELIVGRAPRAPSATGVGHRQPRGVPAARRRVRLDGPAVRGMGRGSAGAGHSTLLTKEGKLMTITSDAPADTTMMRIVHDALRRDLARASGTLAGHERASAEQRRAIGAHLTWMMHFLRAHHAAEDDGLYPLVRERAGTAAELVDVLDRMVRQHEAIASAVAPVETAAMALAADGSDDAGQQMRVALDALAAVLLPHLREEEDEAMPITARLITEAEWQAIEKQHNLEPKSMSELGFEGHWLIDSASDTDRAAVIRLVPPLQRLILLRGFAGRYRRHAEACWTPGAKPARRVQLENSVAVTVEADIDDVWDVVRDVTRVGEWSHECVGAEWLDGSTTPVPGARFRGRNRAGIFRWGRVCEVVSAEPYELVWRTVPTAMYPDSSEWRIALDRFDSSTRISQHFRVLRAPKVLAVLYALAIPAHRDRTTALTKDLQRLGTVASQARIPA